MPRVVVAGSNNNFTFSVIDFTAPAMATVVQVNPMFGGGNVVAISGTRAACGNFNGNQVGFFDVSDPAVPVLLGQTNVPIAGIGAIAIMGSVVAVGELNQNRVALIDFTTPAAPTIAGPTSTGLADFFNSIGFLGPTTVVAGGPNDARFAIVNFAPAVPVVTVINAMLGGSATIAASSAAMRIIVGNNQNGNVNVFDGAGALLGGVNVGLPSIDSIALSGTLALAGSLNSFNVARINIAMMPPVATVFNAQTAGNNSVAIEAGAPDGTVGVCGAFTTTNRVTLFNLLPTPPVLLGTLQNAQVNSISTIDTSFVPAAPPPLPIIAASPMSLAFGVVRVGSMANLPVQISNTGTAPLAVNNLAVPAPFALLAPPVNFNLAPGQSRQLNVQFSPVAVGAAVATLTMGTNVPATPVFSVPLMGAGANPTITVSPNPLNLGNVAVCQNGQAAITISNTGGFALTIQNVHGAAAPFATAGIAPNTAVPPGGARTLTVTFTPAAPGPANGAVTINSDDPVNPAVNVVLVGTGLPKPAPAVNVTPLNVNFGAVRTQFWCGFRVTVANANPCVDLALTLTTNGAPFFVVMPDPTSVPMAATPLNDMLPANQSKTYVVVFAAGAIGNVVGNLRIAGNELGNAGNVLNPVNVPLAANVVGVANTALEFVLDRSGSMADIVSGTTTRMDELKRAVKLFADVLVPSQGDELGLVEFDYNDATPPAHPPAAVLTARAVFDSNQLAAVKADVDTLAPRDNTSIGAGLQVGANEVAGSAIPRKAILVFTDGQQNRPPDVASVEPAIVAAGTEVYAVGLGNSNDVDSQVLSQLAATTGGKFFLSADTLILRKNFVQVLADAFRQNMVADPVQVIRQGMNVNVPISLTGCDRRVTFVLNWADAAAQVGLEVRAPDGTLYTPHSSLTNQLVREENHPGYQTLQIAFPPRHPNAADLIGPQVSGVWQMRLIGTQVGAGGTTCTTSVLSESDIQMRAWVEFTDALSPIIVWAEILREGVRVCGAQARVVVNSPRRYPFQVLRPGLFRHALETRQLSDRTGYSLIEQISRALTLAGGNLIPMRPVGIPMIEQPNCRYRAQIPAPGIEGVYDFTVDVTGLACNGQFQRYASFSWYVPRAPSVTTTTVSVPVVTPVGAVVVVTLTDANGVRLGPGLAATLAPSIRGGSVRAVQDNLDGTYTIRVAWRRPRKVAPNLTIKVGHEKLRVPLRAEARGKTPGRQGGRKKSLAKKRVDSGRGKKR